MILERSKVYIRVKLASDAEGNSATLMIDPPLLKGVTVSAPALI